MMNAKGVETRVPTETVIETIRRARITHVEGIRDPKTGEAGVALFRGTKLRMVIRHREMQAVMDFLTVSEMEALFNYQEGES
ncbi:hypothetical protein LRQ04_00195 [Paenarthrobacter sp. AR 02]|uniref:hypothetical protein n=1 Tax=Paenarthrobacter sp. AR 02 TaxID=2899821 RepID=UPI001F426EFE|nr:hypothetical protein [Paenarthrobacter sp. AR 02]MCF3137662.1 hypothetical protein [Paenarthrobacter sp. AR 02]